MTLMNSHILLLPFSHEYMYLQNLELGVGRKLLNPHISPNCGQRELKFFLPLEIYGTHTQYECHNPNPNNGAWTIVVIKNFTFFDEGIFQISSLTKVKNVHKSHFVER